MPQTVTELANQALARLGLSPIASLDDQESKAALHTRELWDFVRDEVFSSHRWNDVTRRAQLSQLAEAPRFGFAYQHQLPSDFLRLCEVNTLDAWGNADFYEIEGERLLTDFQQAQIIYIARVEDVATYSTLLKDALVQRLAAELAAPLLGDPQLRLQYLQEYENRNLARARMVDAQQTRSAENHPVQKMFSESMILQSRYRQL